MAPAVLQRASILYIYFKQSNSLVAAGLTLFSIITAALNLINFLHSIVVFLIYYYIDIDLPFNNRIYLRKRYSHFHIAVLIPGNGTQFTSHVIGKVSEKKLIYFATVLLITVV